MGKAQIYSLSFELGDPALVTIGFIVMCPMTGGSRLVAISRCVSKFVALDRNKRLLNGFRVSIVRNTWHYGTVSNLTHSADNAYINGLDFDSHDVLQTTW